MMSFFQLPDYAYHLLVLFVWSITPFAWLYTTYFLIINWSLGQYFLRFLFPSYCINNIISRLLIAFPKPNFLLFVYASIEVLFSIYYLHLTRKAQRQLEPVQHDLAYRRDSFERVVRSGLEPIDRCLTCTQPHHIQFDQDQVKAICQSPGFEDLLDQDLDSSDITSISKSPSTLPSTPSSQHTPISDLESLVKPLAFEDPRAVDFRSYLVVWFRNCKWEEIYHENVMEWLIWVLFSRSRQETSLDIDHKFIDHICKLVEHRAGRPFPQGYNPRLQHRMMRLARDPIRVTSHPFTLYAYISLTDWAIKALMKSQGFVEMQATNRPSGLRYLVRKPVDWDKTPVKKRKLPFIFLHGLILGLINYHVFLAYLSTSKWARERPVMILIQPSISLGLFDSQHLNPLSKDEFIEDMNESVNKLGFDKTGFEILGHSNGTMVAAWIIKSLSYLVKGVCLVDPVCFCLWEGHVCYNFLYSKPQTGLEKTIRYFLATELGIAKSLHRHFDWILNTLWPHELAFIIANNNKHNHNNDHTHNNNHPKTRLKIFIAGQDTILNPKRVEKYLHQNGLKTKNGDKEEDQDQDQKFVVVLNEAKHGQMLAENGKAFQLIMSWLEQER